MHNAAEDLKFVTAQSVSNSHGAYNTSNGRYTAPVRGIYLINLCGLIDNSHSSGSATAKVYINGSDSGVFLMYSSGHSKYTYAGGSTIIVLNANDYFTIYGETKLHISNETNFSACLLQAY